MENSNLRHSCKECPWTNDSKNNRTMIESINRWCENGGRKNTEHRCHMISTNIWNTTTPENICIGSLNNTSH